MRETAEKPKQPRSLPMKVLVATPTGRQAYRELRWRRVSTEGHWTYHFGLELQPLCCSIHGVVYPKDPDMLTPQSRYRWECEVSIKWVCYLGTMKITRLRWAETREQAQELAEGLVALLQDAKATTAQVGGAE